MFWREHHTCTFFFFALFAVPTAHVSCLQSYMHFDIPTAPTHLPFYDCSWLVDVERYMKRVDDTTTI